MGEGTPGGVLPLAGDTGPALLALAIQTEEIVTLRISATPHQDHVVLEIADANGRSGASIGLSRDDALALIGSIVQAVNALPHDSSIPVHQQRAFLRAKHPSFQEPVARQTPIGSGNTPHFALFAAGGSRVSALAIKFSNLIDAEIRAPAARQ
jgi:hypothetical protein